MPRESRSAGRHLVPAATNAAGAGRAGQILCRRPESGPAADRSRTGLDEVDDLGMSPFLCHGFASSIQLDEQLALQAKRFNLLVAPRSGPRLQRSSALIHESRMLIDLNPCRASSR